MSDPLPWEEAKLASSQHHELIALRNKTQDKEEQNRIAPYEHRAYAREAVEENPAMAISMAVLAPGYQVAKAAGLTSGRSEVSTKHVTEAYKGIGEGLEAAVKKPWEEAQGQAIKLVEGVKKATAKLFPWEQAAKVQPMQPTSSPLDSGWDKINASYAQGKGQRDKTQLEILKTELANAKSSSDRKALETEIKNVEKGLKNG